MADFIFPQANPAFGPLSTDPVIVDNDYYGKSLVYKELAESIKPLLNTNSVRELFPDETVEAEIVIVEQQFEPTGTTLPIVQKGMPDTFLDQSGYMTSRRAYQPFYMRGSFFVSYGEINSRVKPGTDNERWNPQEQIQVRMQRMMTAHELTWDVFRTYMLCGGINFTDPRTQTTVEVPANIPAINLWSYNVTSGYKGRAEHAFFRTIVDANVADPISAPTGVPWTQPDAAIIECVRQICRWYKDTHHTELTSMYLHPELLYILGMNNQIRMSVGGSFIPKFGAQAGDTTLTVAPTIIPVGGVLNGISVDKNGNVAAIAGLPIHSVDIAFKDPRDGIYKRIMPKNKVIFVSEMAPDGSKRAPGRTQYCISEESGGKPGLWTRVQDQTVIPNAPGMAFQIGNAGLPYIKFPESIFQATVCQVSDIQNRLAVLGDIGLGVY